MRRAAALAAALALTFAPPARASDYEEGMAARRRGDYDAARAAFERMQALDLESGGALEGLSLVALAQRRYEEALGYLERWQKHGDSGYIEGLKARAYAGLRREDEQTGALVKQGSLDLYDLRPYERADGLLRSDAPGVFVRSRVYKSLSQESLETPRPQRIVYEGRSLGVDARANARGDMARGLSVIGGAALRQEAQRNDTGGFTYYDILEQTYTLGAEGRVARARWSASYGQSALSDIHSAGVGHKSFSRVNLYGQAELGEVALRGYAQRAPYFLRGAGGSSYFALLREDSARAEAEAYRWGWGFLARGSLSDYSTRTTVNGESLTATREIGELGLFQPHVGHGYQEFTGAGFDGKLAVMPYDYAGFRYRRGAENLWSAGVSYDYQRYRDGNRLHAADADARLWMPRHHDLSGVYRFHINEYRYPDPSYRSTDERGHWAGPVWRHRWGRGALWTQLALEHGWMDDATRGPYEGNSAMFKLEWYRGRAFSLVAEGRLGRDTVRDESYSATLAARWSF